MTDVGSNRRLIVAKSSDGGMTFTQFTTAVGPVTALDKPILTTGPDPAVPMQENVYVAYRLDVGSDLQLHLAASDDGGASFTDVIINDDSIAGDDGASFGMPAVAADGRLYVVWDDTSDSPTSSRIMLDSSTDGGATFGTDQEVATTGVVFGNGNGYVADEAAFYHIGPQPDRGIWAVPSIAVDRSGGPFTGRIYVAYTVVGSGGVEDTDVVAAYSVSPTGATGTWLEVGVNGDSTSNSQFLPWLDVNQSTGTVWMAWYDARNDESNQKVETFAAYSLTGGTRWNERRIADGQSDQSTANPDRSAFGNYLEYIGIGAEGLFAHVAWSDNSGDPANLDVFSGAICEPVASFSGCGQLVQGVECVLFAADQGGVWALDEYGGFEVGDRVHVDGCIGGSCLGFCLEGTGCLLRNTIEQCQAIPAVSEPGLLLAALMLAAATLPGYRHRSRTTPARV